MKHKLFTLFATLVCATTSFAQVTVTTDQELRNAVQVNNANIIVGADIDLSNSTLEITGDRTVSIDLGGFTLDRGLKAREWNTGGQVITVRNGATLNLSNGTLKGGWGGDGGGLLNEAGGTANLENVNITGCTGDDRGGGISNHGTLTMTGGTISGNIDKDGTGPSGGGGIFNYEGATATLTGVTITDNEAKVYGGAGICNYGTLTIDGCTITGNTAANYGGGIWQNGTLEMQGKNTVTGNSGKDGVSDNVYLKTDALITVTGALTDSKIGVKLETATGVITYGYSHYADDPSLIFLPDDDVFFDVGQNQDNEAIVENTNLIYPVNNEKDLRRAVGIDHANIKLGSDVNTAQILGIAENLIVNLDLNGFTLDHGCTSRNGQTIVIRNGATLNLSNGTLKGGWGGDGGGLLNEGGTVTLTDVNITGNTADDRGGGISNHGTLTMTGGAITNNISQDKTAPEGGGGLFNAQNGTATLTNVTITGNKAQIKGGGGICNYGTMTLDGCAVINNTCQMNGGGIWTAASATLKMKGANTVTGNKSADRSGGVCSDLFLKTNALITVTGSLAGSTIGIDMESESGIFTSGYNTHNSGVDPATIFLPMVSGVMAVTLDGNEAKLASSLAEGEYYYIDHWWDPDNKKIVYLTKVVHPGEYTILEGSHDDTDLFLAGTYVVKGNCYYDGIAYASANTKIILCDGAKLEIEGNLEVTNAEVYLDIYGQARNNGVLQNNANITHTGYGLPGIGSNMDTHSFLAFHGGVIIAHGETSRAGISGGVDDLHSEVKFFDAVVEARGGDNGPGIGLWDAANKYYQKLSIKIYGGVVRAFGGKNAAGIGGGDEGNGAYVEVYGGEVYAWGGDDGAGIGGGWNGCGDQLIVHGGLVKAWGGGNGAGIGSGSEFSHEHSGEQIFGGSVTIYGGEVYAYGGVDAAGIGGGEDATGAYTIIYGGYVYAEGQDEGAGIGGGQDGEGNYLEIHGGTVIAKAGCDDTGCRAIGPGTGCDDYGDLVVGDNMMVTSERKATNPERKNMCWYRTQVRVEVCDHSGGFTYTVDGTTASDHHISHCQYCNHSDTELHTFVDGMCTVCGVQGSSFSAKLYMPKKVDDAFDGQTYGVTTTHLVVPNSQFRLPMATLDVPGYTFIGWEATTTPTEDTYTSSYNATTEGLYNVGAQYTVTGNICFVARYRESDINLYDNQSNGETLNEYHGKKVSKVTLSGRTLWKDGKWNTLCLPFNVEDGDNTDEVTFTGTQLEGATVMELDVDGWYEGNTRYTEEADGRRQTGFDSETGTLYLYFKNANSIEAGKPYIIKWASGSNITSPVFSNVTISNSVTEVESADHTLVFAGSYSPHAFTQENKSILFVGDGNKLYYPDGTGTGTTIGSFRAYFRLKGIEAGDPSDPSSPVRAFVLNFEEEDDATSIHNSQFIIHNEAGAWYTLDGRKLSGKPCKGGIYIHNGRKEVLK